MALSEALLRQLLFSDLELARTLGARLRTPALFADRYESSYWKLRYRLESWDRDGAAPTYDPLLGWVAPLVSAETHQHADVALLAGRRPILLHGDSFAHCLTGEGDCWQGLLDRSALGGGALLLNHGAAGYGLDQIFLSHAASIEAYAESDPIVVVSLMLDADLDRSDLDFRLLPKPWLEVDGDGRLILPPDPVPTNPKALIQREGIGIPSYLWALVSRSSGLVPEAWNGGKQRLEAHVRRVRELTRAILEELAADLRARELPFVVWVFSGRGTLRPSSSDGWRERLLIGELERLELPYLLARQALLADIEASSRGAGEYFLPDGHLNALGNATSFAPLLAELARMLGEPQAASAAPPVPLDAGECDLSVSRLHLPGALVEECSSGGAQGRVRALNGPMVGLDAFGARRRLVLQPGDDGRSSITYQLLRPAARFEATLLRVGVGGDSAAEATFRLHLDGREAERIELAAGAAPVSLQVPLGNAQRLTLSLEGEPGTTIYLAAPLLAPLPQRAAEH